MKLRLEIEEFNEIHPKIKKALYDFFTFELDLDVIKSINIGMLIAFLESKKLETQNIDICQSLNKKWYVTITNLIDSCQFTCSDIELINALFGMVRELLRMLDKDFDKF